MPFVKGFYTATCMDCGKQWTAYNDTYDAPDIRCSSCVERLYRRHITTYDEVPM